MIHEIQITDVARGLPALLESVERGDTLVIKRQGLVVARLVPLARWQRTRPYLSIDEVLEAWKARRLDGLAEGYGLYRVRDTGSFVP